MSETTVLKCQVRIYKPNGHLHLFFKESSRYGYSCFTFQDGHNECVNHFRVIDCKPVDDETANEFMAKVQRYYDSIQDDLPIKLQLVKRF
jgi:hypothetical protein